MTPPPRERLGRGLGALLGEYLGPPASDGEVRTVPLKAITPNPLQPRKEFPEGELAELSASIARNGLLQPLVVRPAPGSTDRFQLVAGERRFRAITDLRWEEVPAVVREVDDETLLVLALVENLQRQELSPMEEAEGYRTLGDSFHLSPTEIGRAVGKDRSTVSNFLRLLRLPPSVRKLMDARSLSPGHARALLALEDPERISRLAHQAVAEGWSVRRTEARVKASTPSTPRREETGSGAAGDAAALRVLEEELRVVLATRVRLRGSPTSGGTIEIPFATASELERLFSLIAGREASDLLDG